MIVLDASAIVAFFKREPGAEIVADFLQDADEEVFVHAANLCEVFHAIWRYEDEKRANAVLQELSDAGVIERADMNGAFWRDAGALIAARRLTKSSLPLGDALGIALARRLSAPFVTADKHEISPLHDAKQVAAIFIR